MPHRRPRGAGYRRDVVEGARRVLLHRRKNFPIDAIKLGSHFALLCRQKTSPTFRNNLKQRFLILPVHYQEYRKYVLFVHIKSSRQQAVAVQHFPIFLRLAGRRVVVSGAGHAAAAKLRLLLKTDAEITAFGPDPDPEILSWHREGALRHVERRVAAGDLDGAALLYCASGNPAEDARAAALARRRRIPVNIVDNLDGSDFLTPAIVDRDPVTVAIGTEGTAPVLARNLKAMLEAQLPASLGRLARIGQAFRGRCDSVPAGRTRRALWSEYFFRRGPRGYAPEGEKGAREALRSLLDEAAAATRPPGFVSFVGAGPGDPELLTLRGAQPAARGGRRGA